MTLEEMRQGGHLLFECVSGSHAYGLARPESDLDLKGVFVLPRTRFLGLQYIPQLSDDRHDEVYYELGRFVELLSTNNPTALEMLGTPPAWIRYQHPLFARLKPALFLSRRCEQTFAGYAAAQIRKARGLNKKIHNPLPKVRKGLLAFCHVVVGAGTQPLLDWLAARDWEASDCGLSRIPHARNLYALFYDPAAGYRGILSQAEAQEVALSSIPPGCAPEAYLSVNQDGYKRYCRQHREYWDWVARRNEARYQHNLGQGYDTKNMMHTFRLLQMAEEILRRGEINVQRPNREALLAIREGSFAYEELLTQVEALLGQVAAAAAQSPLPAHPDIARIEAVLVGIREAWYERG